MEATMIDERDITAGIIMWSMLVALPAVAVGVGIGWVVWS